MTATPKLLRRDVVRMACDSAAALIHAHLSVGGVLPQGGDHEADPDSAEYRAIAAELTDIARRLETRARAVSFRR